MAVEQGRACLSPLLGEDLDRLFIDAHGVKIDQRLQQLLFEFGLECCWEVGVAPTRGDGLTWNPTGPEVCPASTGVAQFATLFCEIEIQGLACGAPGLGPLQGFKSIAATDHLGSLGSDFSLGQDRQEGKVCWGADGVGVDSGLLEALAVEIVMLETETHHLLQSLLLDLAQLLLWQVLSTLQLSPVAEPGAAGQKPIQGLKEVLAQARQG